MLRGTLRLSLLAITAALLTATPSLAPAQNAPPGLGVQAPDQPDPPLPPGSADDLAARMRARRDAQAGIPPSPDASIPASGGTGSFGGMPSGPGGFGGGMGGMGGMGGVGGTGRGFGGNFGGSDNTVEPELRRTAPVSVGADPAQIVPSDKWITQIIPLKNLSAGTVYMDLRPTLSNDAMVSTSTGANCLVITDTAAHVRHLMEVLAALDKEAASRPAARGGRGGPAPAPLVPLFAANMPQAAENGVLRTHAVLFSDRVSVLATHDGLVAEAYNAMGHDVKKGDVLLQLDTHELQAHIIQDEIRIQAQQLAISRLPADAKEELQAQKLQLSALRASLDAKQLEMDTMTIRAPIDGQTLSVQDANVMPPGTYILRGTLLAIIASQDRALQFKVLAADARRLHVGQKLKFSPLTGDALAGEITYIAPLAEQVTFESPTRDKIVEQDIVLVRGKLANDLPAPKTPGGSTIYSGTVTITLDP